MTCEHRSRLRPGPHMAVLGLMLAACGGSATGPEDEGARPRAEDPKDASIPTRVVLITLDTLRLDSFSGGGDGPPQMARTVEWAQRGAVFQNYFSCSSTTLPAHASMLTGLQPWEHGATANGMVFSGRHRTVAEILSERGFETKAVVASFPLHSKFGLDQGFDVYLNEFGEPGQTFEELADEDDRDGHLHSLADRINERAFEALDAPGERDQFLWFHYFDAHAPYGDSIAPESNWFPRVLVQRLQTNPEELDVILTRSREQYRLDVQYLDRHLNKLFERIAADARYDTHVVVVSDHGEAFGEGGTLGHGKRLVQVQIQVPLFIVSPRVEPGFRTLAAGSIDIAPTLLALAGLRDYDLPGGRDLSADGGETLREVYGMRRTFTEPYTELRIDGTSHLLEDFLFFAAGPSTFLVGNSERVTQGDTDRPIKGKARTERYRELFAGFQATLAALPTEAGAGELDESTMRALEQLGYAK